jgi:hypothetical protein
VYENCTFEIRMFQTRSGQWRWLLDAVVQDDKTTGPLKSAGCWGGYANTPQDALSAALMQRDRLRPQVGPLAASDLVQVKMP